MMTLNIPLHPDDVLFFTEVSDVIRKVAKHYALPLTKVLGLPMPLKGLSDRLGDCSHDGVIRLVMRATVDGKFVDYPMSPEEVWRTAAHELAHLRHMNHGEGFQTFELEMREAVANFRGDHRQKVIDKLVKLQASMSSEAQIGNAEAAEAFASAINRMLIEHELHPSDLDYARATADDPVIELRVDMDKYQIEKKRTRVAWQESLARVVAKAHLCTFLLRSGSNQIWFVGTKSHATVAEYVYAVLLTSAQKLCDAAYHTYGLECGRQAGMPGKWLAGEPGFRQSWAKAFIDRIAERLEEAKQQTLTHLNTETPGSGSLALIRLDGALAKVNRYIDDKFKARRGAAPLARIRATHAEGQSRGRAAADAMPIGRRGVTGGTRTTRGLLE